MSLWSILHYTEFCNSAWCNVWQLFKSAEVDLGIILSGRHAEYDCSKMCLCTRKIVNTIIVKTILVKTILIVKTILEETKLVSAPPAVDGWTDSSNSTQTSLDSGQAVRRDREVHNWNGPVPDTRLIMAYLGMPRKNSSSNPLSQMAPRLHSNNARVSNNSNSAFFYQ